MPLLTVDLRPIERELRKLAPRPSDMTRLIRGLGAAARQRWIGLAQSGLHTSARDYIQGIQEVEMQGKVARIVLVGVVPNMVEWGWPPTDLRTTLLGENAKNAKTAKDGSRYNIVPFRHGTPGTSGRNVGPPMPKSIHDVAKKLAPTLSRPLVDSAGGPVGKRTVSYGGRLHLGMSMSPGARAILERKEKPWHSTSIYMGMIREQKQYKQATQSSYQTFRTISSSTKRGKMHWLHPGITARKYSVMVQADIGKIANELVAAVLRDPREKKK